MTTQKNTFCRICEPACPIKASINDKGKVIKLSPNPEHPSGGIPCHKGLSFLDVQNSPDRLNWPLKRNKNTSTAKGEFERTSWDEAFNEIGQKIRSLQKEHGPNSIAFFLGNPGVFDSRAFLSTMPLIMQSGTQMNFSAGTQDMTNKSRGVYDIYGTRAFTIPDLAHTNYLLCLGANPKVSHWTLLSQPNDSLNILKNIKARGGKSVFVNPRKIESSMPQTGETLQIKPGTDVYFLAAVLNEISKNNNINQEHVAKYGKNLDKLLAFVEKYPAEKVSDITGIATEDIKLVAKEYAEADGAAAYISTGVAQSGQGLMCHLLVEIINFVTGNLGRKGGTISSTALINNKSPFDVTKLPTFTTSIGELSMPAPGVGLPAVLLPDLIEGGDIKALIVFSGNPMLSLAGENRMREAFSKLDLLVTIDIMHNATAEVSDYALPATSWIERADINFIGIGMQGGHPYVHYTDAMEKPGEDRKEDWWIIARLSQEFGIPNLLDEPDADGFKTIQGMLAAQDLSIEKLKNLPQQTQVLPVEPYENFYEHSVLHADKKVECYPPAFVSAGLMDRCDAIFEQLKNEAPGSLKLGSLRTNQMHNTWMSNVEKFRKGSLERNPLHMCSQDAKARGLFEGDEIRIFNEHGSINTILRVNDDMRPGAVAMSHGYTKDSNPNLSVADQMRGANCNKLMPLGAGTFEPLSNMSQLCAVPVEIESLKNSNTL